MANDRNIPNIAICGSRYVGKSTLAEKIVGSVKNKIIYDPNNEYVDRGGINTDIETFKNIALNVRECMIVWEEATIFFPRKGEDKKLTELLVSNRHRGVMNILIFHSLGALPIYIKDQINYIYLFHTKDTRTSVKRKFEHEELMRTFDKIRKEGYKKGHYEIIEL